MAYTNVNGVLEVVTDNIFIEQIYNEQYNNNELVITVLKNTTWPLISYKLEDNGEYCFNDNRLELTIIKCRKVDYFTMLEEKIQYNHVFWISESYM